MVDELTLRAGNIVSAIEPGDAASLQFQLSYPFPDPANEMFKVAYTIPALGELALFDLTGRRIWQRTLDKGSGTVMPGRLDLRSGVYLLRLSAGERNLTQKVTVIK